VNAAAGILFSGGGSPTIVNTIVYFNSGPGGAQNAANQIGGFGGVSYCCVQGGFAGTGNIASNPMFVNAGGGDYHLASGSRCADAGNNAAVPGVSTIDLGGASRIEDDPIAADTGAGTAPIVDIGAYERPNDLYETFCFGDGSLATPCPCGNTGSTGHGCLNSDFFSTGAVAWATGSVSPDSVRIVGAELLPTVTCIFLQGDTPIAAGAVFGDGLRCVGGSLKRLYVKSTDANGTVSAPGPGNPSITARSAMAGDTISPGTQRYYQIWYRDSDLGFCPSPTGNAWNVTAGVVVHW
jgi:hypothetical protein